MVKICSNWLTKPNSTRIFRTEAGSFEKYWLNDENCRKRQICHSTRIFETEAGSWKKFLLNGANGVIQNERGFDGKNVVE